MESSLLKLSRAYERGSMNKETYRKRRSDLIQAVLDEEESDRTITNRGYMKRHGSDPMVEAVNANVNKPKVNLLITGGIAVLLVVVVVVLIFSLSGENESDSKLVETNDQPPKFVNMEKVEVLKSYTKEVLKDGQLDFDESENFLDRWTYAPAAEKEQWLSYTADMLISARANGDQDVTEVLDSLYFEIDVVPPEAPEPVQEAPMVAARAMNGAESIPTVSNSEVVASAVKSKTEEVLIQERTSQTREAVDAIVAKTSSASPVSAADAEAMVAKAETVVAQSGAELRSASSSRKAGSVIERDVGEKPPVRSIPVESKSSSAAPVTVAKADVPRALETSASEPKPSVDLAVSFLSIESSGLELEFLVVFLKDYRKATPQDKTNFVNQIDSESLQTAHQATTTELGRYNQELQRDNRYEALRRISSILRRVINKQKELSNDVTGARPTSMSEIKRRAGQNFTIQLFASATEKRVQQLVKENAKFSLYYVKAQRGAGERYILLEGNYSTKEQADKRKLLVPQLEENLPWTRTNANLLADMN